jgi:hypothetical protein
MSDRVAWNVGGRHSELFQVIADLIDGQWEFWEKSSYEIVWYPLRATRKLIRKAEQLRGLQASTDDNF